MTSSGISPSCADPSGLVGRVGIRAFAHPRGILGRLGGTIMSQSRPVQRWVVDLLRLEPTDRVPEVGSGPWGRSPWPPSGFRTATSQAWISPR